MHGDGLVGGEGEVDARGEGLTLVVVDWLFVLRSDQYSTDCLTVIFPDLHRTTNNAPSHGPIPVFSVLLQH